MPNPPVKYTSKDFDSFRQSMVDGIPSRIPEWTSRSANDFGIVLIDLFSYMGDILSYYGDRIANEAFLPTATQRQSVLNIAKMLGYSPKGNVAATVDIQISGDSTGGDIIIPSGTRFRTSSLIAAQQGTDPIVFETTEDLTLNSNLAVDTDTVAAKHGVVSSGEIIGVSDGTINQKYDLFGVPVVEGSVGVSVDEGSGSLTWTFLDNLVDAGPTDRVFTTELDANSIVSVVFGDGVNGKVPVDGAELIASYRVGGGEVGNVGPETIVEHIGWGVGGQNLNQVDLTTIKNPAAASGGGDAETIAQMRANIPSSLTALNRAVTAKDYASLTLSVSGVAKAQAVGTAATSVTIYVAAQAGVVPSVLTTALSNAVNDYLDDKKMVGTDLTLLPPVPTDVNVNLNAEVISTYHRDNTRAEVEKAVRNLLAYDNVDFGEQISVSDLYAAAAAIPGVLYITVSEFVRADGTPGNVEDVIPAVGELLQANTVTVTASGGVTGT